MVSNFVLGSYVPSSKPKTKSDTPSSELDGYVMRRELTGRRTICHRNIIIIVNSHKPLVAIRVPTKADGLIRVV